MSKSSRFHVEQLESRDCPALLTWPAWESGQTYAIPAGQYVPLVLPAVHDVEIVGGPGVWIVSAGAARGISIEQPGTYNVLIVGINVDAAGGHDGIKITSSGGSDPANQPHHIELRDLEVKGAPSQGVLLTRTHDITLTKLWVHGTTGDTSNHGLYVGEHADRTRIKGGWYESNAGAGIKIEDGTVPHWSDQQPQYCVIDGPRLWGNGWTSLADAGYQTIYVYQDARDTVGWSAYSREPPPRWVDFWRHADWRTFSGEWVETEFAIVPKPWQAGRPLPRAERTWEVDVALTDSLAAYWTLDETSPADRLDSTSNDRDLSPAISTPPPPPPGFADKVARRRGNPA